MLGHLIFLSSLSRSAGSMAHFRLQRICIFYHSRWAQESMYPKEEACEQKKNGTKKSEFDPASTKKSLEQKCCGLLWDLISVYCG